MTINKMNRREVMRMALLGGVGASLIKYDPNVLLNPMHYGSVDAMQNMLRALSGRGPEAERLFGAFAQQTTNDVVFVHVKFFTGMNGNYLMKVGGNSILNKAPTAGNFLSNAGFNTVADRPEHKDASLNKYFSNMLYYGTLDGQPRATTNIVPNTASEIAASDAEAQGILADYKVFGGTGLSGIGQHNQQTFNMNFDTNPTSQGLGCLNYFLENSGVLKSPMGIVALGTRNNVIANQGGTAARGAIISEFSSAMKSMVADGYVKKSDVNSLSTVFDKITLRGEAAQGVRDNVRSSVLDLKSKVGSIDPVMTFQTQTWNPSTVGTGLTGAGTARTTETIGYFALAGRASGMGLFNNFAIGVNTIDLNGQNMDIQDRGTLNAVDAIQQTAVGLHILIKKLKEQGKSYVIEIESELSRNLGMGDSGVLSAVTIVGGPKFRSAYRSSFLAPMTLNDTNAQAAGFPAGALVDASGSPQGQSSVTKDQYRLGVAQMIAEATGQSDVIKAVARPRIAFKKA